MKKYYTKAFLIKKCIDSGLTDVELTYNKSEGWWLRCNQYDDWLSMDSSGAFIKIKKIKIELE